MKYAYKHLFKLDFDSGIKFSTWKVRNPTVSKIY